LFSCSDGFALSALGFSRLTKSYQPQATGEVTNAILSRATHVCTFIEWRDGKLVSDRYASLDFVLCVDVNDNESNCGSNLNSGTRHSSALTDRQAANSAL
jgi:hypothetical protein